MLHNRSHSRFSRNSANDILRKMRILSLEKKIKQNKASEKRKRGRKKLFSQVNSFITIMNKNTKIIEKNKKADRRTEKKYYLQKNNNLNLNMKSSLKFKKRKNLIAEFCDNTETPSRKNYLKSNPVSRLNIPRTVRSKPSQKSFEVVSPRARKNTILRKVSRNRNNSTAVTSSKRISALLGKKKRSLPFYQKRAPCDLINLTRFRTQSPAKASPSRVNGPASFSRGRLEQRRGNVFQMNAFQKTKRRFRKATGCQKQSPRLSNQSVSSNKNPVKGLLMKKLMHGRGGTNIIRGFRRSLGRGPAVKVQLFANLKVRDVFTGISNF